MFRSLLSLLLITLALACYEGHEVGSDGGDLLPDAGSSDGGIACGAETCGVGERCCPGCEGDRFCVAEDLPCPELSCPPPPPRNCDEARSWGWAGGPCEGSFGCLSRVDPCCAEQISCSSGTLSIWLECTDACVEPVVTCEEANTWGYEGAPCLGPLDCYRWDSTGCCETHSSCTPDGILHQAVVCLDDCIPIPPLRSCAEVAERGSEGAPCVGEFSCTEPDPSGCSLVSTCDPSGRLAQELLCGPTPGDCRGTGCAAGEYCVYCWTVYACIPEGAVC